MEVHNGYGLLKLEMHFETKIHGMRKLPLWPTGRSLTLPLAHEVAQLVLK